MYAINDKIAAIKQVQKLLGINESGKYDNKTRDAVIDFQKQNNLQPTGIVDYASFTRLCEKFLLKERKKITDLILPFPNRFPYKRGDHDESIEILNSMLCIAIDKYDLNLIKPRGNFYSGRTENAVIALRHIFLLNESLEIDEIFYERLQRL